MPEAPKLPDDWTEPERWAWQQIAAGKEADFNEQAQKSSGAAEPLDPKSPDGWGPDRRLRADFLQHILTDPSFVEATPYRGVRIRGALIDDEPLDLKNARLPHQFWLEKSRIETGIQGRNIRVDGGFSLERSYVAGAVQLPGAKIAEGLSLAAGASFAGPVILNSAKVTGPVSLNDGASFSDEVDLTSARIGADLDLSNAAFAAAVRLTNARIGSELRLGSKDQSPGSLGKRPARPSQYPLRLAAGSLADREGAGRSGVAHRD